MNRPGGPAAGMIPVGNIHFTSPTHSAFIPPLSLGDQQWCSRLPTASSIVGKHEVTQETQATSDQVPLLCIYGNGTSPTLPEPGASAATTSSAPPNVARMACSEVAWPAMTERLRGAGPRPRIILSQITILDGGASLLATGGSGSPSPPLPRNVTSRPAASVSLGLESESALPTCRRHLSVSCGPWCEKCKALLLQPAHPGGTTMVGDHTTARQVCRRTSGDEFRARTCPLPAAAHRADLAATHAENPVKTRHMVAPEPCVSSSGIAPRAPVAIGPPHHDRAASPAHWGPAERWRVL